MRSALPYDPGAHDIEAVARGRRTWSAHVELGPNAQRLVVTVPTLEPLPPSPAPSLTQAAEDPARKQTEGNAGSQQRLGGIILSAVGAASLVGGAVAGVHAKDVYDSALAACNGSTACSDEHGLSLRSEATTWATVSTIGFIAGGAVLAGGAILLTAPRERAIAVGPSPVGTGLAITGRF